MARFVKNTVVLAKLEATYGTDPTPTGGANAILVSNCRIEPLKAQNQNRDNVRGYFGGSQQLVGTAYKEVSFDVELAGSGTATTPTKWSPLLLACGFAETLATASCDYTPISTFGASSSATIYYYLDGVLHKLLGARGTVTLGMKVGEIPKLRFRFVGLDGGDTATSNATPTLTGFQTPVIVKNGASELLVGSLTYTAATGVLSGGTAYPNQGLEVDVGNTVVHQPLVGSEVVPITDRDVKGNVGFDLTAAQTVSFMTDVKANTNTGVGITHGTVAGNIVVVHGPAVQRIDPTNEELNGQAMQAYGLRFVPTSGNDELRIVTR